MSDFNRALRRLHERHGVRPRFTAVHAAQATPGPVIVEGFASTVTAWPERILVAPFAYGAKLPTRFPPLLYRHRPHEIAGTIEDLEYDAAGTLWVRARVEHHEAKLCDAFSIGLGEVDVEWANIDDARAFYVAITKVHAIEEISQTPVPRNPAARVQVRRTPNAYDNCLREMRKIKTLLAA